MLNLTKTEEDLRLLTERVERLERKIDLLTLAVGRVESLIIEAQPLLKIVNSIPFLR